MNIGTPVTFYWTNGVVLAGIVAASVVVGAETFYTVVLFDPNNVGPGTSYANARSTTDKTPGTFEIYSAS